MITHLHSLPSYQPVAAAVYDGRGFCQPIGVGHASLTDVMASVIRDVKIVSTAV